MLHTRWITLPPSWKLQDVQAALNVTIAFLCAASVFVLVRSFWVLAARKVTKHKEVPAYSLLSLNTIGETIDVAWLLRHELFTNRYRSLLVQCFFVLLLTFCTLFSGFIARFSTRNSLIILPRMIEGSLASRDTVRLLYDGPDISLIFQRLQEANFTQNKLVEFWPDPNSNWVYNEDQWYNGSWTMQCSYNESVVIPDTSIVSNNCTKGFGQQWPWIYDNWQDWKAADDGSKPYQYDWDSVAWNPNSTMSKDMLFFVFGSKLNHWVERDGINITDSMTFRTVVINLKDVPINRTDDPDACLAIKGPVGKALYTSATCDLKRDLGTRSGKDLDTWGAGPDGSLVAAPVANTYLLYYAGRLRRESDADRHVTIAPGKELVTMYQAYLVAKDTSGSLYYNISSSNKPRVERVIDVEVSAPQVSLTCVITACAVTVMVLVGLINYWTFVLFNLKRLERAPQSKLDWMLQTLRREDKDSNTKTRHKLRMSISSVDLHGEAVPLTDIQGKTLHRSKSMSTTISSVQESSFDNYSMNTPATTNTDFTGDTLASRGNNMWSSPPQYHSPPGRYHGLGLTQRHDYDRVPAAFEPYTSPQLETAYDPGKKWTG